MLLRNLFLILSLFLLSLQAGANTFKGNKRKQVSVDAYPFRAVVRIHPTLESKSWCSGFLIGAREVKTGVHCLKDKDGVPLEEVYVFIVSNKYPGYDQPFLVKTRLDPNDIGRVDAWSDQHTLILDEDIGTALGYFGVNINGNERPGFRGQLDDSTFKVSNMSDFCSQSYSKPMDYILDILIETDGEGSFAKSKKELSKYKACSAGYPYNMSLDKITVEDTCALAGVKDAAMVTNCSVTHGSSGGPLFYRNGDQYFAYGVISKGRRSRGEKDGENVTFGDSYFNLATILEDEDLYLEAE